MKHNLLDRAMINGVPRVLLLACLLLSLGCEPVNQVAGSAPPADAPVISDLDLIPGEQNCDVPGHCYVDRG